MLKIKNTKKKLRHTKKSLLKAIEKQHISELESIQLNDLEGGACEVYIFPRAFCGSIRDECQSGRRSRLRATRRLHIGRTRARVRTGY